jgi:hypothetical protein
MRALLLRTPARWLLAVVLATLISAFALIGGGTRAGASPQRQEASPPQFVVSVSPGHGPVGGTFQATLTISGATCYPLNVDFYVDGAVGHGLELAPAVTMPESCQATATIKAPSSWSAGPHRIVGTYVVPIVPRQEQPATFNVDAAPSQPTTGPTSTPATPSPKPSAGGTSAAPTGTLNPPATITTAPAGAEAGATTPQQSSAASAPSSVDALAGPSAQPSSGLALPVAAEIHSAAGHASGALLWISAIGIIAVGLFGGWVVRKQQRDGPSPGRTGGRDSTGRHRL